MWKNKLYFSCYDITLFLFVPFSDMAAVFPPHTASTFIQHSLTDAWLMVSEYSLLTKHCCCRWLCLKISPSHVKTCADRLSHESICSSRVSDKISQVFKSTQVKRHSACGGPDLGDPIRATGVRYWINRERVWCICWSVWGQIIKLEMIRRGLKMSCEWCIMFLGQLWHEWFRPFLEVCFIISES